MRLVQITVPPGALSEVKRRLDEDDVDYFATAETATDEYDAIVYFSVKREELESVVADLYEAGIGAEDHVVVLNTEVDIHGKTSGERGAEGDHERIAASELHGQMEGLLPDFRTFVAMVVLSAVVATTGLLLDSVAVVVGAMVIAPLFGPAVSASVGTVIDEEALFTRGVRLQIAGVAIAVASAALFAWVAKTGYFAPTGFAIDTTTQIVDRLSPDILSLVVALVAGTAGVISIATGARTPVVGVMMAAALLPPAAIVGIAIAWWEPLVAVNAGILLGVNLLAINFAGLVTLWYLGYRPGSWVEVPQSRKAILTRAGALLLAIVLVSGFLVNVTYANVQRSNVESAIREESKDVLDRPQYENISLIGVKAVQDRSALFSETERVVVTIGRPPGEPRPAVRRRIDRRVGAELGRNVTVDVRVLLVYHEDSGTAVSRPVGVSVSAERVR